MFYDLARCGQSIESPVVLVMNLKKHERGATHARTTTTNRSRRHEVLSTGLSVRHEHTMAYSTHRQGFTGFDIAHWADPLRAVWEASFQAVLGYATRNDIAAAACEYITALATIKALLMSRKRYQLEYT